MNRRFAAFVFIIRAFKSKNYMPAEGFGGLCAIFDAKF
jgi:hypothetical protein